MRFPLTGPDYIHACARKESPLSQRPVPSRATLCEFLSGSRQSWPWRFLGSCAMHDLLKPGLGFTDNKGDMAELDGKSLGETAGGVP